MASSLVSDHSTYNKAFRLFLECSTEHQCMREFICNSLPESFTSILTSEAKQILDLESRTAQKEAMTMYLHASCSLLNAFCSLAQGKSSISVLGVGSGSGEMDLQILSQLHKKNPDMSVDYEVVEPSSEMMESYKALVSKSPNLEKINFTWNQMTASEYEKHSKIKQPTKKMDFIHMIQMLYYVADPNATVSFFRSLLSETGKLLVILVSGESGWEHLWRQHHMDLCNSKTSQYVTTSNIKSYLDTNGISYKAHVLQSTMDITECFTPGDEKGERLLDFLTELDQFSRCVSPELKASVINTLQKPECSTVVEGRVLFNNNLEALILDP